MEILVQKPNQEPYSEDLEDVLKRLLKKQSTKLVLAKLLDVLVDRNIIEVEDLWRIVDLVESRD